MKWQKSNYREQQKFAHCREKEIQNLPPKHSYFDKANEITITCQNKQVID